MSPLCGTRTIVLERRRYDASHRTLFWKMRACEFPWTGTGGGRGARGAVRCLRARSNIKASHLRDCVQSTSVYNAHVKGTIIIRMFFFLLLLFFKWGDFQLGFFSSSVASFNFLPKCNNRRHRHHHHFWSGIFVRRTSRVASSNNENCGLAQVGFWTSHARCAATAAQGNTTVFTPATAARDSSKGASAGTEHTSVNPALRWGLLLIFYLFICFVFFIYIFNLTHCVEPDIRFNRKC